VHCALIVSSRCYSCCRCSARSDYLSDKAESTLIEISHLCLLAPTVFSNSITEGRKSLLVCAFTRCVEWMRLSLVAVLPVCWAAPCADSQIFLDVRSVNDTNLLREYAACEGGAVSATWSISVALYEAITVGQNTSLSIVGRDVNGVSGSSLSGSSLFVLQQNALLKLSSLQLVHRDVAGLSAQPAVVIQTGASLLIDNCLLSGNLQQFIQSNRALGIGISNSTVTAAVLDAADTVSVVFNRTTFTQSTVNASNANIAVSDCVFETCASIAVSATGGSLTVDRTRFSNNTAAISVYAAVDAACTTVTVSNTVFENHQPALSINSSNSVVQLCAAAHTFLNAHFTDNWSTSLILNNGGSLTVRDSRLERSGVQANATVISTSSYGASSGELVFDNVTFANNSVTTAVVYCTGPLLLTNSAFTDNYNASISVTAALYVTGYEYHKAEIVNTQFLRNRGGMNGASVLSVSERVLQIDGCLFTDNSAPYGAGVYVSPAAYAVEKNGILFNSPGHRRRRLITNDERDNNEEHYTLVSINNSVFTRNKAQSGAALYLDWADVALFNCTFINNTAVIEGTC
jgi:hypothetical protein